MSAGGDVREWQQPRMGGSEQDVRAGSVAGAASAAAARAGLADLLRSSGRADARVGAAIRCVPRHLFLPGVELEQAYRDRSVVVKSDNVGLPASASTQPALMAIMLGQLGLARGHRVLEVGTGTGYNAALIAWLVGARGSVVTIDVDAELTGQARANLACAGYERVKAVCGDGAAGVAEHAPYDRIIVTAGAWDVAPRWREQLGPGSRIVLPLSIRGIQVSVALQAVGGHLEGRSAARCSFIWMSGALSGPERVLALGPQPGLHAQVADGPAPDAGALYEALCGPVAEVPTGLRAAGVAELADLDLWLALTGSGLTRLNLMGRHESLASPAQQRIAGLMPVGGFARPGGWGGFGAAAVVLRGEQAGPGPREITACGYGPGGRALAGHLARRAAAWDQRGRPGVQALRLSAWPPGTPREVIGAAAVLIDRPHARLAVHWPGA